MKRIVIDLLLELARALLLLIKYQLKQCSILFSILLTDTLCNICHRHSVVGKRPNNSISSLN